MEEKKIAITRPLTPKEKHFRQGFRLALHLVYRHFDGNGTHGGDARLLRILQHVLGHSGASHTHFTDAQRIEFFTRDPETLPHALVTHCGAMGLCHDGDNGCIECPGDWEPQ